SAKRTWIGRGQGIYRVTAELIVYAAQKIFEEETIRAGVLSPGAAFEPEPLLKKLERVGFELRAGPLL
ncbi:MAG: hypothetical protein ACRD1Z_15430, partial [Vicinamibacteria bacterium]